MVIYLPIADALKRTQHMLLQALQQLEMATSSSSNVSIEEMRIRLDGALANFTEHFWLEEKNGYMKVVKELEPRWDSAILQLREDRRSLKQTLDALIAAAGSASRIDDDLRTNIRAWIESVHQHQVRENTLVKDAFEVDIGGEGG